GIVGAEDRDLADDRAQRGGQLVAAACHAEGDRLQNRHGAIAIDDEAGQRVGLAPHEADSAAAPRARGHCARQTPLPEARIDGLVHPGEDPAAERRSRVEQAAPDEPTRGIDDSHDATGLEAVRHVGDVTFEDPRMHTRAVVSALEPQDRGHQRSLQEPSGGLRTPVERATIPPIRFRSSRQRAGVPPRRCRGCGCAQLAKRGTYTSTFAWNSVTKVYEGDKDHIVVAGEYTGVNLTDGGQAFRHQAAVICPAVAVVHKGMAFLVWQCRSPQPGARCDGEFQWTGGTGKYTGLRGKNSSTRLSVAPTILSACGAARPPSAAGGATSRGSGG